MHYGPSPQTVWVAVCAGPPSPELGLREESDKNKNKWRCSSSILALLLPHLPYDAILGYFLHELIDFTAPRSFTKLCSKASPSPTGSPPSRAWLSSLSSWWCLTRRARSCSVFKKGRQTTFWSVRREVTCSAFFCRQTVTRSRQFLECCGSKFLLMNS